MRIIIAGAGELGYHLAKLLAQEEKDIILIDQDRDVLEHAAQRLDVGTILGSATSPRVLEEAEVSKAELLIAVTSIQEVNITVAILGKQLGAKRTVARVSNIEFINKRDELEFKKVGIDEIISPESLAAREIKRLLKESALTDSFEFDKGVLTLMGVLIDEDSTLLNTTLNDSRHLNPDNSFTTVAILRGNETIIPYGENKFKLNDHAYFIAQPDGVEKVISLAGKERIPIKNIMVLGGSKLGVHTAKQLSRKYNIKLIEENRSLCIDLADELSDTMVINGDGRDYNMLMEEGMDAMDAFIAVTDNSETNIIASLVAKKAGVKKTIALVENIDYIHLSQSIGVDTLINKKLIAANFIFRYIRRGQVVNLTSVHGVDAEVLEFEVQQGSNVLKKPLQDLDFPRTAIVGGVIRNGHGITARGDFRFEPKDRVVVLSRTDCIHAVESFFK